MNNKLIYILLGIISIFMTISCDDDDDDLIGNWVQDGQFGGDKRCAAVCWNIDGTIYLGMGYNGSRQTKGQYFFDMYKYGGPGSTIWEDCDDFPGGGRQDAFAFSIDGKGYVGCGYYGDTTDYYYSDVWEFDPNAEKGLQWTQLDDFPGGARTEMVSFEAGGNAYVAGGKYEYNSSITFQKKDCYMFDPDTKTFKQIQDMGYKRAGAFSFVIDDIVYVGGGSGTNGRYVSGVDVFNPKTGLWNEGKDSCIVRDLYLVEDITEDISHYDDPLDLRRKYATAFAVDGKGYIAGGFYSGVLNDCWEYDPKTDLWTQKSYFEDEMYNRQQASSFTIEGVPYIFAGCYSSDNYLDDMWHFKPNDEEDEDD